MTKLADISRDSSTSFGEDNEEVRVRKFCKHMLKSTLFIGTFQEKRFVDPLGSYRDVIKVADDETDLIDNLLAVRKRLTKFFQKDVWIGITEPRTIGAPAGHNLWVSLDEEVFGSYWYKIKTVEFHRNEVCLKLQIVRPVTREKTPVHNISHQQESEDNSELDLSQLPTIFGNYFKENVKQLFTETLSYTNIKDATIFVFLLISTLITFLIQTIKYLLDYFLKLMHEFSGLIRVCTPIIVNLMRLIANIINGFYNLIATMWRERSTPETNSSVVYVYEPQRFNSLNNRFRALPPPYEGIMPPGRKPYRSPRSQVRITPID